MSRRVQVPPLALTMMIHSKVTDAIKTETDMLAVFAFAGKTDGAIEFSDEAKRVDAAFGKMITEIAVAEGFEAKKSTNLMVHTHGKIPSKRVLLVGLGKVSELTLSDWQNIAAQIGRIAKGVSAKRIAV